MNSDARRVLSQLDARADPDPYQYYVDGPFRDRRSNTGVVATVILLVAAALYQLAFQQGRLPSLPQLLWDALVVAVPARLLFAIDSFVHPSPIANDMLRSQQPTRAAKSDALQRIFGLNNAGGILGSASQVGRRGLSGLSNAGFAGRAARDRPPGLGNYDNSCYQNSILQGLASLKPLPAYLSAVSVENKLHSSSTRTADTLRDLIAQLSGPSRNGATIWTPNVLKNMSTWQQQDAQEYYSKLLDQIDDELGKAARAVQGPTELEPDSAASVSSNGSDDSGYHSLGGHSKAGLELRFARNPLEGLAAQRVACVSCGYCEGLTMIPFNCLTLTLGNFPEHDLYERLDHYTKVEAIQGVECPRCTLLLCRSAVIALAERTGEVPELRQRLEALEEALEEEAFDDATLTQKCKITPRARVNSTKTKQVALARPPQSLVFHVNRSGFDENTGYMYKNSAAVRFPMMLDLGPWCLGSSGAPAGLPGDQLTADDIEEWTLDPKASMVAGNNRPSKVTGPIYELRAVVTHYGHHENGHYVCYRKHPIASPPAASKRDPTGSPADVPSEESTAGAGHEIDAASDASGKAPSQDEEPSQWWRLSDEDVTKVDEQTVLGQGGVFMLFYDCVEPNSVLVSTADNLVGSGDAIGESKGARLSADLCGEAQDMQPALTVVDDAMELDGVRPPPNTPMTDLSLSSASTEKLDIGLDDSQVDGAARTPPVPRAASESLTGSGTSVLWSRSPTHDQETDSVCSGTTMVAEEEECTLPQHAFSGSEVRASAA